MSKEREALKLAIALLKDESPMWALEILENALAQPAQEPVAQPASEEDMKVYRAIADNYRKDLAAAQPAQGPVAEIVSDVSGHLSTRWNDDWTPNEGDKLYIAAQPAQEPITWSDKQLKMLNFLYGSGEFDGVYFEEKHPTERNTFWWRKHLRQLFDTPLTVQPAQEPVAWITPDGEGFRIRFSAPTSDVPLGWDALYTAPPKRPWVNLTDDQVNTLWNEWKDAVCLDYKTWAKAIEAKLKELNA